MASELGLGRSDRSSCTVRWSVEHSDGCLEGAYRLVAGISTLCAQGLFIHREKLFVGGKQVDRVVQHRCVRYVIRDKIVISTKCSWILDLWCLSGKLHQALYGGDVFFPLRDSEIAPVNCVSAW